ncbi:MAG: radical SAM protein [Methanobacterium sp.]|jgi:radical SAM superfamily enzyme YgiQ (UPF0313 family)
MLLEHNVVIKDLRKVDLRFASCYPNLYRSAMSSLGFHIIYDYLNSREDVYCERVVYPYFNSLESGTNLKDFDVISFSLQYEQDYFHVLEMLNNSDIPLRRRDRNGDDPLIIAGGPCASSNPLPMSDFIDLFIVGEAEVILDQVLDTYKGLDDHKKEIDAFLEIEGVYIPNNPVKMMVVKDMGDAWHPINQVYPETNDKKFIPAFGKAFLLEVSRGCSRGCRFCMAGCIYRPRRELSINKILDNAEKSRKATGLNKVALIGAAVSDYSRLEKLCKNLYERDFQITTPSLRIESVSEDLLNILSSSGLRTITIAPESTWRVRKVINKPITDNDISNAISKAFKLNLNVKLYFMIGLPAETCEDLEDIVKLVNDLKKTYSQENKLKISVNPFIPKSHTPFQWEHFDFNTLKIKMDYLNSKLKFKSFKMDNIKISLIQYVLAMGDFNVGDLIEKNVIGRIPLTVWKENMPHYNLDDTLPWKNIEVGVKTEFLKEEFQKAWDGELTPWCETFGCYQCGSCENEKKF